MSGRLDDFVTCFGENLRRAIAAAAASGADTKGIRQFLERAGAALSAFAQLAFGYRVAEADIHAVLSRMLTIRIVFLWILAWVVWMLAFTSVIHIDALGHQEDMSLTTIMITIIVIVNRSMNTERKPRVGEPQKAPQKVASAALLGANRELVIVHNGREYRLRLTQNDKLILTA